MPYFYYSFYIFCSLRSYKYIKNYPIFKLLIDKWQKIRKLNCFLKNSLGGSRGGFFMDFTLCFQIYGLFIFRRFSEKWTLSLKFELLEAVKFKNKL